MSEGAGTPNYALLVSRFKGSRQWDRVLDTARQWLATDPENSRAHLAAGQSLLNLGQPVEAENHLGKVLQAEPQNSLAHRFISIAYFRQKRYAAADESIQKAISLNPTDPYHWFHLAEMFYRQGDPKMAKKYAIKARELAPRDSDILNLIALCEPSGDSAKLEQYEQALELDPENAEVHNNIGAYHLNNGKNYEKAEESFRRALFFKPSLKMARANLLLTLKHRDPIYRVLCAPKDFIFRLFAFMRAKRRQSIFLYVLILPVWILAFRFVLAGLVLWCCFVWPLVKAYEYLTVGDIRANAGEIGARRGGLFNYRHWPLKLRLAIFACLLLAFWGGIAGLMEWKVRFMSPEDRAGLLIILPGVAMVAGLIIFAWLWLRKQIKADRLRHHARKRAKRLGHLLETTVEKK